MTVVVISNSDNHQFDLEVVKLTSMGFDCVIPVAHFSAMRDPSGRICTFSFSMSFQGDDIDLEGEVAIHSMRRVTQEAGEITCRFVDLSQTQRQILNEYLSSGKVVSLNKARLQRRA